MSIKSKGTVQEFTYSGSIQEFVAPSNGLYKFEVWGAKGGGAYGGKGGYSVGYKVMEKGETVYICCGGSGAVSSWSQSIAGGYNGGGIGIAYRTDGSNNAGTSGGGGGATHISTVNKTLADIGLANKSQILIVAGGGGGFRNDTGGAGGTGGGLTGGTANKPNTYTPGGGGTQTSGGSGNTSGSFGKGGNASVMAGGGGGGLYGGGSGYALGGGGGSGYIGGVPEITYKGVVYTPSTTNGQNDGNGKATITLMGNNFPTMYIGDSLIDNMYIGNLSIDDIK